MSLKEKRLEEALRGLRVGGREQDRPARVPGGGLPAGEPERRAAQGGGSVLLDTVASLQAATALLGKSTVLAVDCEGVDLGRTGRVATVQLCAETRGTTYIVDVVVLGAAAFSPEAGLRALLESTTVSKLFFDVRADANALFHLHGVKMPASSVIDLQLLDVCTATLDGRYLKTLGGLGYLLEKTEHGGLSHAEKNHMALVKQKAKQLFAPELGGSYSVWLARPLPQLLVEYATDVRFFHALLA